MKTIYHQTLLNVLYTFKTLTTCYVQIIFIKYDKYCWNISADFKVTAPLLDMQLEHVYVPHVQRTATQDQSLCCNYVASAEAE